MMTRRKRVGIYGGTFAPPHIGHVHAAICFLREAELDRLIVMPTAIPPHKLVEAGDDPYVRLAMTRAAFENVDSRIEVSDYEIAKEGVSYTYLTLQAFQSEDTDLYFLCGTDMFLTLDRWRNPQIVFDCAVITCMMRVNDADAYEQVLRKAEEYRRVFNARTVLMEAPPLEAASSDVRAAIRAGEEIASLVPPSVLTIIQEKNLYTAEEKPCCH